MPARAVTRAVDDVPEVTDVSASVIDGVAGGVTESVTATVAVPGALVALAAFRSMALSVSVPGEPDVNVTVLTPALVTPLVALVSVPLVIDHAYVIPERAATVAVNPEVLLVTLDATLMAGVTGAATTVTLRDAAALVVAPLLSLHVRAMVPTAPAVYVRVFVDPLVTPAVPPALVMVPPVIVHW